MGETEQTVCGDASESVTLQKHSDGGRGLRKAKAQEQQKRGPPEPGQQARRSSGERPPTRVSPALGNPTGRGARRPRTHGATEPGHD